MAQPSSRKSRGKKAAESDEAVPFEDAIERLEGLVDQLEQGDLSLESALGAFEEGVQLSKHCAEQLDAAEQRIEVLTREGGELLARPLDEVEDAE